MTNFSIEAFVTTNGRSTFNFCVNSLLKQTLPIIYTVIQGKLWREALDDMVVRCRSEYFLRIDDDFVLHPKAIEYMCESFSRLDRKDVAQYSCLLWETWTYKRVSGVKMYNRAALKSIGGHQFDEFGKADKKTNQAFIDAGYALVRDESVVGLHICGSWNEQLRYEKLWKDASSLPYSKSTNPEMEKYCLEHGLLEQVNLCKKFLLKVNKTRFDEDEDGDVCTDFARFLTENQLLLRCNKIKRVQKTPTPQRLRRRRRG